MYVQKWGRNVQNAYHKLWRKTKGTVKCIFSTFCDRWLYGNYLERTSWDKIIISNLPENKTSNDMLEVYQMALVFFFYSYRLKESNTAHSYLFDNTRLFLSLR